MALSYADAAEAHASAVEAHMSAAAAHASAGAAHAAARGSSARRVKSRETVEDSEGEGEVTPKKSGGKPKETTPVIKGKPFVDLKKRAASGTSSKDPRAGTATEQRTTTASPNTQWVCTAVAPERRRAATAEDDEVEDDAKAPVAKRTREAFNDYVEKHGSKDDHVNTKACELCAGRSSECVSPKPGARCHWCGHSRKACSLAPPKVRVTRGSKKTGGAESKKDAGELAMDLIDGGDADAEGEDEEVVEVKKGGAKKLKRKVEEVVEAPPKKKVKVDEDRGEESSRGAQASPRKARLTSVEAAAIGRREFPDRYFGESKRSLFTQSRLQATRRRMLVLESEIAVLKLEAAVLYDLAEYIKDGIASREEVEEEKEEEGKEKGKSEEE